VSLEENKGQAVGRPDNNLAPMPRVANPRARKTLLWFYSIAGSLGSIALIAAALAPSPGQHVRPIGGIGGFAGLFFSIWLGWRAHLVELPQRTVESAKDRIRSRGRALKIVKTNPVLATELRIGRPDLIRKFDDGGLVDVNHVPATILQTLPGISTELAVRIVATRKSVGGFDARGDLEIVLNLEPHLLDEANDFLLFLKID
jgi:hypothetical protein